MLVAQIIYFGPPAYFPEFPALVQSRQPLIYRLMESVGGPGRPKMTWKQLTERDRRQWKLTAIDPHDRDTWKSGVNLPCVQQASCLEAGPLMWIWPLYLHVNKKSDDDDSLTKLVHVVDHLLDEKVFLNRCHRHKCNGVLRNI